MAKICGGAPSTICKGNMIKFTWNIHPTDMMNVLKNKRGIKNPTKREGLILQEKTKKLTGSNGSEK